MQEPQSAREAAPDGAAPSDDGLPALTPVPLDRSYLLRRESRYPFPQLRPAPDAIRFRRARRVSGSFRAIGPLRRNGRS